MVIRERSFALILASTVAALLLVATLALALVTSRRFASQSALVDQTMLVKVTVGELVATLRAAESGERGYVLMGRPEFLDPYRRAKSVARARVEQLRVLTADNQAQRPIVNEVARLTTVKLDELQRVIERRDQEGQRAATAILDTDLGLHTMGALQGKLDTMVTIEDMHLAECRARRERYGALLLGSLVVTSGLFGLSAALIVLWSRSAELRRRSMESEEARLRSENEVLQEHERSADLQERFAAILGHDLRNPLSSVAMGVQVLQSCRPPAQQQRTLDRMASSAARMSRMIDQLLDVTRCRLGGGIAVTPAPMNLGKLVTDVAEEASAAHPGHKLVVEAVGDLEGEWDSDRLAQVVSNLVGNALVHGAPDGGVRVSVHGFDDTVEVDVQSAGRPIPEEEMETLFEPFRRSERPSATSHTSGLGLGLYITKEIVVAHGGAIEVKSPDGDGTTFHVVLPRASDAGSLTSRL